MNLTPTEIVEPLILAVMAVCAWRSPIRHQALWSVVGFVIFISGCHYALGVWGDGQEATLFAGILAHMFAICHIKFNYDRSGLFIGVCMVGVGVVGGLATLGRIPITVDNWLGADAWTYISVLIYLSWGGFFKGVGDARKSSNILNH